MISESLKIIFIHVNKTGGTSVSVALRPWERLPKLAEDHDSALAVRAAINDAGMCFKDFWSFAVVRNPWDRIVSSFQYRKQRLLPPNPQHLPEDTDFTRWLVDVVQPNKGNMEWSDQSRMLEDRAGQVIVDEVFKFEEIDEAWKRITGRLGLALHLPHANKTNRKDYRSYYTDQTAQIVADRFPKDISRFGYNFDPS